MIINERPYNISYSLNDIRYIFQLDDLTRTGLKLQVKLLYKPLNGSYTELYTWLLQPAPDGKVYLYMQEYLNSVLSYVLPDINSLQLDTNADKQACIFTVQFREITDIDTDPLWITTETETYTFYCIKGGIEKSIFSRNNFFKYFEANQPFLSWQPTNKFIDINQTSYLTFLNPNYISENLTQVFVFCYRLTDIKNNKATGTQHLTNKGLLFHLRIALLSTIQNVLTEPLYSLEIGVVQNGTAASYNFKFFFEYRPAYVFYDLLYINSLGGIDTLRVKADVTESYEREMTEGSAGMDVTDMFSSTKMHELFYPGISLRKKFKGDIGYHTVKNKNNQYSFIEILSSPGIYMWRHFRYVPVTALQKSQDLGTAKSSLNSFPIEWALSESNEVFTPELPLMIGDTSNLIPLPPPPPPVCANVTQLFYDFNENEDGTYDIWPVFQPVPGVRTYTIKFINRSITNIISNVVTLNSDTAFSAQATEYTPVPPGNYSIQVITHCSETFLSPGITIDFTLVPFQVETPPPPPTPNTIIENDLASLIVQDVIFDGSICTPYDNLPLHPSASGSATLPTGIASRITIRLNNTPTSPINIAIRINGSMTETSQVTTFYSSVILSANTYTLNAGDSVKITLF